MKSAAKKSTNPKAHKARFGRMSKAEATRVMREGVRHIHSSQLGTKDPLAARTETALASGEVPVFPWEDTRAEVAAIQDSSTRHALIQRYLTHPHIATKRDLKEKVQGVLEELITNALFHSYRQGDGTQKYRRTQLAKLSDTESIKVQCTVGETGVFISITDQGGTHDFDRVATALNRCYEGGPHQIEEKEGGAGLGLYMVFETVTHWKIVCSPGKQTTVSCWISDKKSFEPETFSFNYFDGAKS